MSVPFLVAILGAAFGVVAVLMGMAAYMLALRTGRTSYLGLAVIGIALPGLILNLYHLARLWP